MNSERPNYEALYKVTFRKHHELLNEIEDLLKDCDRAVGMTGEDAIGMLRLIHEKYTIHDWSH